MRQGGEKIGSNARPVVSVKGRVIESGRTWGGGFWGGGGWGGTRIAKKLKRVSLIYQPS